MTAADEASPDCSACPRTGVIATPGLRESAATAALYLHPRASVRGDAYLRPAMPYRAGEQTVLPLSDLHPDEPDAVGYLERSIASSPVWQMGPKAPERDVSRRDPRLLDFLASAKNAPLGELEFDVLTWTITRWYQLGRPPTGRLSASFGEIAHALYGQRQGGKQYALIRQALDHLYSVSLDLTVLSIDNGN